MRKRIVLVFMMIFCISYFSFGIDAWIRINNLGYLPYSIKNALLISESPQTIKEFSIHDALTNKELAVFNTVTDRGEFQGFQSTIILDFSTFNQQGAFYIKAGLVYSPTIYINKNVYLGSADFLLNYLRQQRCGNNISLNAQCHLQNGFEVYGEEIKPLTLSDIKPAITSKTAKKITPVLEPQPPLQKLVNINGGWHNATENIQFGSISANVVYQLLFAYQMSPASFSDKYDADGRDTINGCPDILDEAKWGLDWLLKMYPSEDVLYHQVADDRDHEFTSLPADDDVDYGWGEGNRRPVFLANGKPQGLFNYKNRSTGIASIAGKYASAFALGAEVMKIYYPKFADTLGTKAVEAYLLGKRMPGVCQSAPGKLPQFYEEDNWTDDMELAATQLYRLTYNNNYLIDAAAYGRMEPISPWMCSDTTRNYQWYPFINLGHYVLAGIENPRYQKEFTQNILSGIQRMKIRASENPFNIGVPLVPASNNMIIALATQCRLYRTMTKDSSYLDMETALIDWFFGRNPWGANMIVGLPENAKTPLNPYSFLSREFKITPSGGVLNGPVYKSVFKNFPETKLSKDDVYERFQSNWAVYHDDNNDFVTNQPTIDGSASLTYLLGIKQQEGVPDKTVDKNEYSYNGIIRTDTKKKQISLVFTGHEYAAGYKLISSVLKKQKITASFFFSGDFYRNPKFADIVKGLQKDNHYLGAHSNSNQLYCSFLKRDSLLISKAEFLEDLKENFNVMEKFGIYKNQAPFFVPPYEWYNDSIAIWAKEIGLQLINYTPGTLSYNDNSTPDMRDKYFSSTEIYKRILQVEKKQSLNGHILMFHIGVDNRRSDKFYTRLNALLLELKRLKYEFVDLYQSTDVVDKNPALLTGKKQKRKN